VIVLDANIIVRAVFGRRARAIIAQYSDGVRLVAPVAAIAEAQEHVPDIIEARKLPPTDLLIALDSVLSVLNVIEPELYTPYEQSARERIRTRDQSDWRALWY
jgi:predicted nucleic acid-binding protein